MALITCPRCGKEISDKAKNCVRCGWEVNLEILSGKKDKAVSFESDHRIDMTYIEHERKRMLREAELEIEKMKENARQEIKSMNETARLMTEQRMKELELEYKRREKEFAQKELEQMKKEQTSVLQHTGNMEKKANFLKSNFLFMLITIFAMVCLVSIVWKKLDDISSAIEELILSNQVESEIPANYRENTFDLEPGGLVNEMPQQNATDGETGIIASGGNDSRVQVTYDSCKVGRFTHLIFTMKNISEEDVQIEVNSIQYINDIAVKQFGTIEYNPEIPAGKATVINFGFERDEVPFSEINKIELECKSFDSMGNTLQNDFIFDNLNVKIK